MFLWFLGAGLVMVWNVFHDPGFDYRLLVLGLLLPDLVDGPLGGARVLHSITASVVLLTIVVVGTIGRRMVRKRLLALAIGTFLHLVLDGAFNDTRTFWWPFSGISLPDGGLPSFERSAMLNVVLEAIGLILVAWWRFEPSSPVNRRRLWRTGTVAGDRDARGATC